MEDKAGKNDAAADAKKKNADRARENRRNKSKYSNEDIDDRTALSSYADNRYTAFNAPEGNYRTRSRWQAQPAPSLSPSQLTSREDSLEEPEWSRFDFPGAFSPSGPSFPFDSNPGFSSASSCSSLIDLQYPIFSDVCGAVPQARYSLPNTFGHRERSQIAQVLNALTSSSADGPCMRSLRLLICPMLFPPCQTRREPPPVLPCQSYCRAVKSRCDIPVLDTLPCEILPQSSSLCPVNPGYGSFAHQGGFPSANSPLSSNFPTSRSYPSLQSQQAAQSLGSSSLFSNGPFSSENLSPHLVDFPSRALSNDYNRPSSRYSPSTRSSSQSRSQPEARFSAGVRP